VQVWRSVLSATYPPGPYRDGMKVAARTFKRVEIRLALDCGHRRTTTRKVGLRSPSENLRNMPDSYVVEAPPARVRCPECEAKAKAVTP